MSLAEMGATLLALAQKVRLRALRKSPRGPKKPRPKRAKDPKHSHVATAKLLMNRKLLLLKGLAVTNSTGRPSSGGVHASGGGGPDRSRWTLREVLPIACRLASGGMSTG
jgi:hypothetical protein